MNLGQPPLNIFNYDHAFAFGIFLKAGTAFKFGDIIQLKIDSGLQDEFHIRFAGNRIDCSIERFFGVTPLKFAGAL